MYGRGKQRAAPASAIIDEMGITVVVAIQRWDVDTGTQLPDEAYSYPLAQLLERRKQLRLRVASITALLKDAGFTKEAEG